MLRPPGLFSFQYMWRKSKMCPPSPGWGAVRRKQARRAGRTRKGTVVLTLAALWEAWTVFCCAAFLIIQELYRRRT